MWQKARILQAPPEFPHFKDKIVWVSGKPETRKAVHVVTGQVFREPLYQINIMGTNGNLMTAPPHVLELLAEFSEEVPIENRLDWERKDYHDGH